MQKTVSSFDKKHSLLLHCCCAPCSSECLLRLKDYFDITVYYYNPNIEDEEYFKRKAELSKLIELIGVAREIDAEHDKESFYNAVRGLEHEKEGGKRCEKCFYLRLEKTAQEALRSGYEYFCTTLTISPLKDAKLINKIGRELEKKYGVKWLDSDFKKRDGYLNSIKLSKKYNLYRQDYCGCVYSKIKE